MIGRSNKFVIIKLSTELSCSLGNLALWVNSKGRNVPGIFCEERSVICTERCISYRVGKIDLCFKDKFDNLCRRFNTKCLVK